MSFRRTPLAAVAFAALTAAAVIAPSSAAAQATPAAAAADSMAFPRQAVKWFQTAQADSLFSHAGDQLKASMQSAANTTDMMSRMATRFGELKSTDAEVQFDDQGSKVFIAISTYATAPEQVAMIVRYTPGKSVIDGFSIQPLSRAKERFPNAKLP
jgi:hypothetical protein